MKVYKTFSLQILVFFLLKVNWFFYYYYFNIVFFCEKYNKEYNITIILIIKL